MKEDDIVDQLRDEIVAAISSDVEVRTSGGDQDALPPVVVIDWNASRIPNANGHNTRGGYITDSNSNNVGVEHHTYWRMTADCIAREYSESDRDAILNSIHDAFIPYEWDATDFHEDTREWEVGNSGARSNPIVEPDWYEAGILLEFDFVKRTDQTGMDHITDFEHNIEVNE